MTLEKLNRKIETRHGVTLPPIGWKRRALQAESTLNQVLKFADIEQSRREGAL